MQPYYQIKVKVILLVNQEHMQGFTKSHLPEAYYPHQPSHSTFFKAWENHVIVYPFAP